MIILPCQVGCDLMEPHSVFLEGGRVFSKLTKSFEQNNRYIGVSQKSVKIGGHPGVNDAFGYSVGISSDGNTAVIGAFGEDSNATGVNGDQTDNSGDNTGAVYLF